MLIEIGAPASLPLGLVRIEEDNDSKFALLGMTLQHPPILLAAQAHNQLKISGPRADVARRYAQKFLAYHTFKTGIEAQIELSIPAFVGLGSETMLGLSLAQSLAWAHDLPVDDTLSLAQALDVALSNPLEVSSFAQGGLLLVDMQARNDTISPVLRRTEIAHAERDAWALILYFPNVQDDTPESIEQDRLATLLQAGPHLSAESGRLVTETIWPAIENDDIASFGQGVMALQALNQAALAKAGISRPISADDQTVLDLMKENGAVAWGQSPTGFSFYGLIKGAQASIELRKKLRDKIGYFGGTVMATITANTGARYVVRDQDLKQYVPPSWSA